MKLVDKDVNVFLLNILNILLMYISCLSIVGIYGEFVLGRFFLFNVIYCIFWDFDFFLFFMNCIFFFFFE